MPQEIHNNKPNISSPSISPMQSIEFPQFFAVALVLAAIAGSIFSLPSVWKKYFASTETYLKAGEYGETDNNPSWSPFKEPINAWSSLAYSVFGVVIILTGWTDYSQEQRIAPVNTMGTNAGYSLLYGGSMVYLGIASFLFHASHAEVWRKADAGMTSGVMAAPVVFGLWDRARPPSIGSQVMVACAVLIQFSFTHGYLPYGSSDWLLPVLIAAAWAMELTPVYGGAVDSIEYILWLQCAYAAIGGMLLRAADIKRKSPGAFNNIMYGFCAVTALVAFFLGVTDHIVICGVLFGIIVFKSPAKGHLCWHVASSYGLFVWWYLLRTRPGNPILANVNSTVLNLTVLAFFMVVKNGIRRLFMNMTFLDTELRSRTMFLLEHTFFTVFGWYVMVTVPTPKDSWLLHTKLCWLPPVYPFELFHLFYQVKVATHTEDLIYIAYSMYVEKRAQGALKKTSSNEAVSGEAESRPAAHTDFKMNLHHISTAILCIASYLSGYVRIGSIVMYLHDISDIPLDLVRIFAHLNWETAQVIAFAGTVLLWLYWRLFYLPIDVLWNIAYYSKDPTAEMDCEIGTCTFQQLPQRYFFLLLLGSLQVLHVIWFYQLMKKGYVKLACCVGGSDTRYKA
jgi:hypothetical protein